MRRQFFLFLYYVIARRVPAYVPGLRKVGWWLRQCCVCEIAEQCGSGVNIRPMVYFGTGKGLRIGNNSGLGDECRLYMAAPIHIGANVMVGPQVMFLTGNHGTSQSDKTLIEQKVQTRPVVVGDDVWIGARATICPGAVIHRRTVIAAGSVVVGEVGPGGIYAGVPAKLIRKLT